jgi:hypothetical protein
VSGSYFPRYDHCAFKTKYVAGSSAIILDSPAEEELIDGNKLKSICATAKALSIVPTQKVFSQKICGRSDGYLRGCRSRDIPTVETLWHIAARLEEAAENLDETGRVLLAPAVKDLKTDICARLRPQPVCGQDWRKPC